MLNLFRVRKNGTEKLRMSTSIDGDESFRLLWAAKVAAKNRKGEFVPSEFVVRDKNGDEVERIVIDCDGCLVGAPD